MADALERITNLVALLLETRLPLTFEQITHELGSLYPPNESARRGAFERDKALLRDIGVPIETEVLVGEDAGRTGYRIDRRRYELADLHLADDERAALELAAATVRLADAGFGMLKLGGDSTAAGAASVVANVPDLPGLPVLREAVARHAEARFRYHGSERTLQPYALLLREGFWYVIGHDLGAAALRTYRVDRIESDVTQGDAGAFERPPGFDPRSVFPADPRLLAPSGALTTARVLVDPERAAFARRDAGVTVVDERDDGSLVVEAPCANRAAFASWLFGWGTHAEVLEPADVRADVVARLRAMAGVS